MRAPNLLFGIWILANGISPLWAAADPTTYPSGYNTFVNLFNARKDIMGTYWDRPNANWAGGEREQWLGWRKAAEHFGDPNGVLERYAQKSGDAWRDQYVLLNNGGIPAYKHYSDGYVQDWLLNGDTLSRDAVIKQSQNATYAVDSGPLWGAASETDSREVAYTALGYINAEVYAARPHRKRLLAFIELMLGNVNDQVRYTWIAGDGSTQINSVTLSQGGHIEQWLGSYTTDANGNYIGGTHNFDTSSKDPNTGVAYGYAPFMSAYTAYTLIRFNEQAAQGKLNGGTVQIDPRVLPKLVRLADATWNENWIPTDEAMKYRWWEVWFDTTSQKYFQTPTTKGAPDLNNVIFPWYAWLYLQTGQERFRDRAEKLFNGSRHSWGVKGSADNASKQWNDYIRHTFDGLDWYSQGVIKYKGGTPPPPPGGNNPPPTGDASPPFDPVLNLVEKNFLTIPCTNHLKIVSARSRELIRELNCSGSSVDWDGKNQTGQTAAAGTYVVMEIEKHHRIVGLLK